MNSLNVQSAGRKKRRETKGGKKQKRTRRQTMGGKKQKRKNNGGTFLADVSVPAGLLLLNQFMKNRKSKKVNNKRR